MPFRRMEHTFNDLLICSIRSVCVWFMFFLLLSDENVKIMTTMTIFEATNSIYITSVGFNRFHLECEMPNRLQNPKIKIEIAENKHRILAGVARMRQQKAREMKQKCAEIEKSHFCVCFIQFIMGMEHTSSITGRGPCGKPIET